MPHVAARTASRDRDTGRYQSHRPEQTLLYQIVDEYYPGHCCKVSDEAAFCLIQRPYISKTLLTRRISPRGSP
ncbi:hypothetical protein NGUA13_03784 [Salmonella enterica]|nr:hypothetical protein [Salmonella enterica subsp. enterica serovar Typhimurium]GAR53261.1 hypothetical protein NGUA13_03784 [Salmonella enterica]GAR63604.1 hypothetical protein NGUA16_00408 [Salmonella enterica]